MSLIHLTISKDLRTDSQGRPLGRGRHLRRSWISFSRFAPCSSMCLTSVPIRCPYSLSLLVLFSHVLAVDPGVPSYTAPSLLKVGIIFSCNLTRSHKVLVLQRCLLAADKELQCGTVHSLVPETNQEKLSLKDVLRIC